MELELTINNKEQVDVEEVNQILKQLWGKEIEPNATIAILFKENVAFMDIVFIAALFLFYKIHHTRFEIKIDKGKYAFQLNTPAEKKHHEVLQYLQQIEETYHPEDSWFVFFNKDIHELERTEHIREDSWKDKKQSNRVSKEFAPILFIDEISFEQLFEMSNANNVPNDENDAAYGIRELSQQYINKIDRELKSTEVGNAYIRYYEEKNSNTIIDLLKYEPPIISIVYFLFFKKVSYIGNIRTSRDKKINTEQAEELTRRLNELLAFTKDYVSGLNELSKNIIQHSSSKKGIITIRAYLNEDEPDTKGKKIDTYVFDFGKEGVIPTLIKNTVANINTITDENLIKDYKEDMEILCSNYSFKDFIFPTKEKVLLQQIRRSIAHYGLFQFFYLIENHNGYAHASSLDRNNQIDRFKYPEDDIHSERTIDYGTSYFFSFPVLDFKNAFNNRKLGAMSNTYNQSSDVAQVHDILEIATYQIKCNPDVITNEDKTIFIVSSESDISILDRINESDFYTKHIYPFESIDNSHESFLVVDFHGIKITPSNLLRLLFKASQNIKIPIIVSNIKCSTLMDMIELNEKQFNLFDMRGKYPYWINNKAILFFSKYSDSTANYTFADILYGLTQFDYFYTNKILSNSYPNLTTITKEKSTQQNDGNQTNPNFDIPPLCYYFSNSSLRPFDVLPINNNQPLFIQNLEYLLNKKIKKIKEEND